MAQLTYGTNGSNFPLDPMMSHLKNLLKKAWLLVLISRDDDYMSYSDGRKKTCS